MIFDVVFLIVDYLPCKVRPVTMDRFIDQKSGI
jgi:hypothetical protein